MCGGWRWVIAHKFSSWAHARGKWTTMWIGVGSESNRHWERSFVLRVWTLEFDCTVRPVPYPSRRNDYRDSTTVAFLPPNVLRLGVLAYRSGFWYLQRDVEAFVLNGCEYLQNSLPNNLWVNSTVVWSKVSWTMLVWFSDPVISVPYSKSID